MFFLSTNNSTHFTIHSDLYYANSLYLYLFIFLMNLSNFNFCIPIYLLIDHIFNYLDFLCHLRVVKLSYIYNDNSPLFLYIIK